MAYDDGFDDAFDSVANATTSASHQSKLVLDRAGARGMSEEEKAEMRIEAAMKPTKLAAKSVFAQIDKIKSLAGPSAEKLSSHVEHVSDDDQSEEGDDDDDTGFVKKRAKTTDSDFEEDASSSSEEEDVIVTDSESSNTSSESEAWDEENGDDELVLPKKTLDKLDKIGHENGSAGAADQPPKRRQRGAGLRAAPKKTSEARAEREAHELKLIEKRALIRLWNIKDEFDVGYTKNLSPHAIAPLRLARTALLELTDVQLIHEWLNERAKATLCADYFGKLIQLTKSKNPEVLRSAARSIVLADTMTLWLAEFHWKAVRLLEKVHRVRPDSEASRIFNQLSVFEEAHTLTFEKSCGEEKHLCAITGMAVPPSSGFFARFGSYSVDLKTAEVRPNETELFVCAEWQAFVYFWFVLVHAGALVSSSANTTILARLACKRTERVPPPQDYTAAQLGIELGLTMEALIERALTPSGWHLDWVHRLTAGISHVAACCKLPSPFPIRTMIESYIVQGRT